MNNLSVKEKILDLIYPKRCVCCKKMGGFLCDWCKARLTKIKKGTCPGCNCLSEAGRFCRLCRRRATLTGVLFSLYFSEELVKKIIHEYKYEGLFGISKILGELMAKRILEENIKIDLITFVPMTKKHERQRGFNQTELLAKEISKKIQVEVSPLLVKKKETKSQVGLKKKQRQKNLIDAFCGTEFDIRGKNILLVDDVYTTGATMEECANVLKKMGAKEIWGIAAAKE